MAHRNKEPYTVDSEQGSTASKEEFPNAFIDHRNQSDLANLHSSPARARRRNSLINNQFSKRPSSQAVPQNSSQSVPQFTPPLTDRNLRLNAAATDSGSISPSSPRNFRTIAIDMDKYARDQSAYHQKPLLPTGIKPYYDDPDYERASLNSMEFGESNPPSEHSGDSTSLDDVCFPDYYGDNPEYLQAQWPDLKVLQEFVDNELADLNEESVQEHVNFKAQPHRVEDDDFLGERIHPLQVTPTPIQPGDVPPEDFIQTTPILQKKKISEDVCRFTYFRDDLANTIHAPTLSWLLMHENSTKVKEQPTNLNKKWRDQQEDQKEEEGENLKLQDLFQPSYYLNSDRLSTNIPQSLAAALGVISPVNGVPGNGDKVPIQTHGSVIGLAQAGQNETLKHLFPKNLTDFPGTATGTITDSVSSHTANPFWLDVLDPTEEEMKVLSKTFGIHPLTTEDIFLGEAREKVELFKGYYFICFTSFDIVYERRKQRIKEQEKKLSKLQELQDNKQDNGAFFRKIFRKFTNRDDGTSRHLSKTSSSRKSGGKKIREGELSPLSMYMIVFKDAVITFHFSPTPHPINVRRRARLLKDYLTVSSDWISYALIDDITDLFAPMIDSIEEEVNSIEEAILRMHAGESDSDSDDSDSEVEEQDPFERHKPSMDIFVRRQRTKSTVDGYGSGYRMFETKSKSKTSSSSTSSRSKSTSKILAWKRKGDMLRRIGECRKRVMSLLRLLGSKADVIKGFSKRLNEVDSLKREGLPQASLEISMYLGDIQDHIITMVQSLNHYEKLLARFHSNYLAQINIDMTKVNNDTNDVLGKITILGTIVLPINVVTGLWGMNCLVPGQDYEGLAWFWSIIGGMIMFSVLAYNYARRAYGL